MRCDLKELYQTFKKNILGLIETFKRNKKWYRINKINLRSDYLVPLLVNRDLQKLLFCSLRMAAMLLNPV